jgi:subtilisin family serine protease
MKLCYASRPRGLLLAGFPNKGILLIRIECHTQGLEPLRPWHNSLSCEPNDQTETVRVSRMRYLYQPVLLWVTFVLASLLAYGSSASTVPEQVIADYSEIPTLYTLDAAHGEIDESISHREFVLTRLLPWMRWQHHRSPWNKVDRVYHSASCSVSAFAVGTHKQLYAVDSSNHRLCSFDHDGTSRVLWSGVPLVSPQSVAMLGDVLYIADSGAKTVLAFSMSAGRFIESYWDDREVPDKIVGGVGRIVGMNYAQHSVIQMFVMEGAPSATTSSVPFGSVFRILRSAYDAIGEPIDFGVDGNAVYVLDKISGLIYVSLSGADMTTLSLEGITQAPYPSAIAVAHSDSLHLVFAKADQKVEVVQNIRPASIFLDQDDLEQGMIESCKYLMDRDLLPTETRTYADIASFVSDLNGQGLAWNGIHHSDVVGLISKLNNDKSEQDLTSLATTGIRVPALQVVRYYAKRKITLPTTGENLPNSTLGEYVKGLNSSMPLPDTEQQSISDKIQKSLEALNYSYAGKDIVDEVKGTFIVPVPAFRFSAFVSTYVGDPAYKGSKEIQRFGSIVPLGNPRVAIQSIAKNAEDVPSDAPVAVNNKAMESIHVCKIDGVAASLLGVVDFQIDHTHPELSSPGKISTYVPSNTPVPQQTDSTAPAAAAFDYAGEFQAGLVRPATPNDHGTHVAVLAGGNLSGINPKALIKDVSVDNFEKAAREVTENPIPIYNLSLGEKYYTDDETETLRTWIDTVTRDENGGTLFVIAAGNDHAPVVKGMLASAGSRNNVLVVAAADTASAPPREWLDSDQQHGSNFGYPMVGLYAPGANIVSATIGRQYGIASGTSQATAIVSGAASLLKGLDPNYKPWQIKERLISTTSLDGWIDKDHSKGGMLNISRAVHNLNQTVIRFSYENIDCLADVSPGGDGRVNLLGDKSWTFGPPLFSNIRRIHRISPIRDDFELFISYSDPEPPNETHLYRTAVVHSADIVAPELMLLNGTNCGNKGEVDLSQVDDLYNPVLP